MPRAVPPADVGRHRLAVVGAALLFSTGGAGIKWSALGGWHIAGLRSAVAAIALAALFPSVRRGFSLATLGVGCAFASCLVLFVLGNKLTTAANTIFLQSATPLYLLLLAPRLLGEHIRRRDLLVMGVLASGLALFYLEGAPATLSAPRPLLGNLLATASGFAWACTLLGLRWQEERGREPGEAMRSVFAGNVIAVLACAGPMLSGGFEALGAFDVAIVLYLGVVQIGVAYALLTYGLRGVGAFEGSLLILVEPAVSPLWTWWLHGERSGPLALLGGGLILAASTVKGWLDRRASPAD